MARRKPAQSQGRRSWLSRPGLGAGAQPPLRWERGAAGRPQARSVPAPFPLPAPGTPSGRVRRARRVPECPRWRTGDPVSPGTPQPGPPRSSGNGLRASPRGAQAAAHAVPQPGPPCARRADRMAGGSRGPAPPRCDRHSTAGRRAGTPAAGSFPLPRESPLRIGIGARSGAARSQPGSHAQWFPLGTPARPPLLPVRGGTTWAAAGRVLRRRVPRGLRPGDELARVGLGPQPQSGRSPRGPALRGSLRP